MEIFTTTIQNTDTPEIQSIIRKLDNDEDILMTAGSLNDEAPIEVQYIKPINQIINVGTLSSEFVKNIKEKYGSNVALDITDFTVTLENGTYGIDADIEVDQLPEAEEEPVDNGKKLPLPLLIIVGLLTGILTIVLIIVKLIYGKKED
jgi:hypothetical protein